MAIERTATPGSDFPESVKRKARELAFFKCCYCHDRQGHEVHHLIPKEEGGQGVFENAILLCVQCHSDYGHRADKRQQLRQARDHWYEIAAKRYGPAAVEAMTMLEDLATKRDIDALRSQMSGMFDTLMTRWQRGSTSTEDLLSVGSSMVNSLVVTHADVDHASGPSKILPDRRCGRCGTIANAVASFCWQCGEPLA